MQVVQVPLTTWNRIERILSRLEKTEPKKAEWLTSTQFMVRAGKTKEQLRRIREAHPEMVKPKPGPTKSGRYLYNLTAFESFYLQ